MNSKCTACKTMKPSSSFVVDSRTYKTCQSCREYQKQYFKQNTLSQDQVVKRRIASNKSFHKKRLCQREQRKTELLGA